MPRVHKMFHCVADPRPIKIQAFKQPHSSCGVDKYNGIDPRSEASTNSSVNSHSPQKQPCRMTSGSAETDMFLHSKMLARGQWIPHLRPCSNIEFVTMRDELDKSCSGLWHKRLTAVYSTSTINYRRMCHCQLYVLVWFSHVPVFWSVHFTSILYW